ncbi:hypothetical protein, partial [Streptomyces sp. CA2R106]|uniref:hypothetical protein n=1 Tax=Streptomyces sp. CA2R106 TaxID=3120153 RepID=UPI00300A53F9
MEREDAGSARLLRSLGQAHVGGLPVDWRRVVPVGVTVDLPTYAFQRRRYWLESAGAAPVVGGDGASSEAEARFWAA